MMITGSCSQKRASPEVQDPRRAAFGLRGDDELRGHARESGHLPKLHDPHLRGDDVLKWSFRRGRNDS